MAKNVPSQGADTDVVNVLKSKRVRIILVVACLVVTVAVAGVLIYKYAYKEPMEKAKVAESEELCRVDQMWISEAPDSILVAEYAKVADNNKYDSANRAKYMTAMYAYSLGDYEKAIKYVDDYSTKDAVIGSLSYTLKGDALVNLDRFDEAVTAFDKAISEADGHPTLTPYNMTKKAVVLSALGRHADAAKTYKAIEEKYPSYAGTTSTHSRMLQEESLAK